MSFIPAIVGSGQTSSGIIVIIPWPRHNLCRKGVCRNALFPHGCVDVSYRSWDKARTHAHEKLHISQLGASSEPGKHLGFLGPDDAAPWEMCDFCMGMGSCYITHKSIALRYKNWSLLCLIFLCCILIYALYRHSFLLFCFCFMHKGDQLLNV